MCGCVWLLVCLCVMVPYAIIPYLVDTQEWVLRISFNNIGIDLKYYLHSSTGADFTKGLKSRLRLKSKTLVLNFVKRMLSLWS